jgi:hypothetical protein
MLPPMGFFESGGAPGMLSTEATTWFVMTTATPNCWVGSPGRQSICREAAYKAGRVLNLIG